MIRFYIIRHGETAGNKEGRFRGRADMPLNANGLKQAEQLREELSAIPFHAIYSSPLSRALKTAEILASGQTCPIYVKEEIQNITLGEWEGKSKSEIKEKFPNLYEMWVNNPERLSFTGMEPLNKVKRRATNFMVNLADRWANRKEANLAVVTHRAVIKPMLAGIFKIASPWFWKIHMDTAAYCIVEYHPERGFLLYQLNQNKHLTDFVVERI